MSKNKQETFFISGSMFGQKSKKLINVFNVVKEQKCKYLVLKPSNDTRDGLFIKSRDYEETVPAEAWNSKNESRHKDFLKRVQKFGLTVRPKVVLIDEVHFLSLEDIMYIHQVCKARGIMLFAAGLETDFKQNTFPAAEYLKVVANHYTFNHGDCNGCGEPAIFNVLFDKKGHVVKKGKTIQPGDKEYKVFCQKCFDKL